MNFTRLQNLRACVARLLGGLPRGVPRSLLWDREARRPGDPGIGLPKADAGQRSRYCARPGVKLTQGRAAVPADDPNRNIGRCRAAPQQ